MGAANNDILISGDGNDTLSGLSGDDQLIGGQGDDIYIVSAGTGIDRIIDTDGSNTIQFTNDIVFSDVSSGFTKIGDDLLLKIGNLGDGVRIDNFFVLANTIDLVTFDSGGSLTAGQLYSLFGLSAPTDTVSTITHVN